jgi:hypothetical protein
MQESSPIGGGGSTGTVNVGSITACGNSAQSEFIEYLIDGFPLNFTEPPGSIRSQDMPGLPPYSTETNISGSQSDVRGNGAINLTQFQISHNNVAANGLPIKTLMINTHQIHGYIPIQNPNATVNISVLGPPFVGYLEGNFSFPVYLSGTILKKGVCNFRVRRN